MHSPESTSKILDTTTTLSRRKVVGSLGLITIAGVVPGGCGEKREAPEPPVKPHVLYERREVTQATNLLRDGTWGHMPGAELKDGALLLRPADLHILNKREGDRYDPNPPVNLYGSRLHVEGGFSIAAHLQAEADAAVSLRLYDGDPPLRFDDFCFLDNPALECRISRSAVTLYLKDGDQPESQQIADFPINGQLGDCRFEIRRTGPGELHCIVNGTQVGAVPENNIFGSGEIWLGLSSEHGNAQIRDVVVKPLNDDRLEIVDMSTLRVTEPTPNGLQTLVNKDRLVIGTGASLSHMVASEQYAQIVLGTEFGRITPENGMKPQDTQPKEGLFVFAEGDALVASATRHGLEVHGHTLFYDKAMPRWMRSLPYQTEADKKRLREVLHTHVSTVVGHYKGKVASWDVVNEALGDFNDDVKLTPNPFSLGLGEEYIDMAFRAARAADPNAKLFINDYGLETNPQGRWKFMRELVKRLQARGVPIDGIGIQGHVYEMPRDTIKPEVLTQIMRQAADLKLEVRITELDVTGKNGSSAQAKQYADVAKVCLEAPNCTGFTVWGPTDRYGSTISVQNGRLKPGNALLYGANFEPKPARKALAEALRV